MIFLAQLEVTCTAGMGLCREEYNQAPPMIMRLGQRALRKIMVEYRV